MAFSCFLLSLLPCSTIGCVWGRVRMQISHLLSDLNAWDLSSFAVELLLLFVCRLRCSATTFHGVLKQGEGALRIPVICSV